MNSKKQSDSSDYRSVPRKAGEENFTPTRSISITFDLNVPVGQRHIVDAWLAGGAQDTLLCCEPGQGKTTMMKWMAGIPDFGDYEVKWFDSKITEGDLANLALNDFRGFVIIDEVHNMTPKQQEFLLEPLETRNVMFNGGPIPLYNIFFIMATTEPEKVLESIKSRIQFQPVMHGYDENDLVDIINCTEDLREGLADDDKAQIASVAAGSPRRALKLADQALRMGSVDMALAAAGYVCGLSPKEVKYLNALADLGARASAANIRSSTGMDRKTIDLVEGSMSRQGYVQFSADGRRMTQAGALLYKDIRRVRK